MKSILLLGLMLLGMSPLYAQQCSSSLRGKITNKNNGEPLLYAQVKVVGTPQVVYTNFEGKYKLSNLCNGAVTLKITHKNAQPKTLTVHINGQTIQNIQLDYHPEILSEVVVVGKTEIRKSATAQEQTISGDDIDNFSSATLGDALKQMSGVSTLRTGKSIVKPVIQGLSSSRVPVLNNGVRMADQEWGAEHAPNIDLNAAGAITVVKGAAALQYGGDAIGGVVIINKPHILQKDTLYGKTILSGSTNGRGGSISSTLTKSFKSGWYVRAQATYKQFGDFEAPDYVLSNTGTHQRDFSINAGLQKFHYGFDIYYSSFDNHLGILRASSTGSVTDLVKALNSNQPIYIRNFTYNLEAPRQKVHHQLARLQTYYIFDKLGKLSLQYSYQNNNRLEYDIRRGPNKYKPSVDLNLQTHGASANFDFNTRPHYELNVGVNWNYKNNFANPATGVQRLIPDYKRYTLGAYTLGHYQFNSNWLVEAGIRYDFSHIDAKKYYNKVRWHNLGYDSDFADLVIGDYGSQYLTHPTFSYNNISATVGAKYNFDSNYDLRVNYALSNRAPNPSELFSDGLHHSAASIELGDLRLDSENSHKISLSFEKRHGLFRFTVAPYVNFITNYINMEPNGLEETIRGAFLRYKYRQNDARLLGVDVDLNYQFSTHFSYHGKFSTVDGRETHAHRPLIDIPATHMSHAITYLNPDWHHFTFSLHGEAVFKKQHFPNDNFSVKVLDNGVFQQKMVDISTPPKGYFLTGFDVGATFHPFNTGAMEVRLSVDNLFNVRYRNYLNRLRYYADNTGRNITLQLKFNY